jgi:mannose-1-phosphate guanylyltransferase
LIPGIVLTAGAGRRLDPLTRLVAKPAMPFGRVPLVALVLAWLARHGITDLVLNLHHLPATVTRAVGDGSPLGVRVRYSWEDPILGSAGGPRHALSLLSSDSFVIVNGDTLCDFDLTAMAEAHLRGGADVTMALVPHRFPGKYKGVRLSADDAVTEFVASDQAAGSWHFVGVQIARASVFSSLPDGVPAETVAELYRGMVATHPGRIRGWRTSAACWDIGTPRDYLDAFLASGADGISHSGPGLPAGVHRSLVWPGVHVPADATLTDCIVAGPVTLPAGFSAASSIVLPGSILRPGDAATRTDDVGIFPL